MSKIRKFLKTLKEDPIKRAKIIHKAVDYVSIAMIILGIALFISYFLPGNTTISIQIGGSR